MFDPYPEGCLLKWESGLFPADLNDSASGIQTQANVSSQRTWFLPQRDFIHKPFIVPNESTVMPWFTNASVCEQFSSQTEALGKKILLPFTYSSSGDKHNHGSYLLYSETWSWLPLVEITAVDRLVHTCCEAFFVCFLAHTVLYSIIQSSTAPKKAQSAWW